MKKRLFFIVIIFCLFLFLAPETKANPVCTYQTWNSGENLYFQMLTYPDLWDYTHIYFDTLSTEPTQVSNDNQSLWNLGTWANYNDTWENKWCGIRSGTGYDMGCNSNNFPATMSNPIWTFSGVTKITKVYVASYLDGNVANPTCDLVTVFIPSPKLTVIIIIENNNGGTATVSNFTLKVDSTTVMSGETNSFDAGTYTVSETGPAGYASTFSGDCDSNGQIILNVNDQKTCTITNDDIAPPPIKKVVFLPGFGGSWDTNSMLNCRFDSSATWGLAPFAESVYNPLLNTLVPSDWGVIPFYYDWRQPVAQNGDLLKQKIDSLNEKVNLVGHSMGGLVERAYLEQGVDPNKINSFLSVGSPHRGSIIAYPAWSGGEIWSDNFLTKIATTLYLKLCGQKGPLSNDRETVQSIIPSFQDILPIDPYLVSTKNFSPPDINDMKAKNLWMLSDNNWPVLGIKLGSLSGTGFSTLKSIPVKEPSKREQALGNWIDGKPAGKTTTIEGDGTVLVSSSDIPSAEFHPIISQTHSGLVASNDGLNRIREFLGLPQLAASAVSTFSEPSSALILIGYPSSFWIADQNGNVKKDKDGMVALMNPKSGNYKLNLIPKSSNTRFIVAQFLPNGDVKYKEYKFDGFGPKFKNLKFDLQNPTEDILN